MKTSLDKFLDGGILTSVEILDLMAELASVAHAAKRLGRAYLSAEMAASDTWYILSLFADARGLAYSRI